MGIFLNILFKSFKARTPANHKVAADGIELPHPRANLLPEAKSHWSMTGDNIGGAQIYAGTISLPSDDSRGQLELVASVISLGS